jgi:hypothetical protein
MILNEGQPEAWRIHSEDDAAPTLYAERPPAILSSIRKKSYSLLFPLDFAGTLCARDGIKTGPHSPNGEDAYDRKLVVMMKRKKTRKFFSNHQTTSDIREVEIAPCMGATHNLGPSNNNPLVVTCFSSPQDHCVTRGFMEECAPTINAAAGMSGNNRPFIVKSYGFDPIASGDTAIDGEISKALTTAHGRNGAGVLTVKKKTSSVVPINSMVIGKDGGNGDRQTFGIGNDGDPSPTLQAAHHHAVAITRRVV